MSTLLERVERAIDDWINENIDALEMGGGDREEAARAIVAALPDPTNPSCEHMEEQDETGWSEWIHPLPGYLLQCCDCGLVHDMEFAIGETIDKGGPYNEGEGEDGVIIFRARRHDPDREEDTPSSDGTKPDRN